MRMHEALMRIRRVAVGIVSVLAAKSQSVPSSTSSLQSLKHFLSNLDQRFERFAADFGGLCWNAYRNEGDDSHRFREFEEFLDGSFSLRPHNSKPPCSQPKIVGHQDHVLSSSRACFSRMKRIDPAIHADQNGERSLMNPPMEDTPFCSLV